MHRLYGAAKRTGRWLLDLLAVIDQSIADLDAMTGAARAAA